MKKILSIVLSTIICLNFVACSTNEKSKNIEPTSTHEITENSEPTTAPAETEEALNAALAGEGVPAESTEGPVEDKNEVQQPVQPAPEQPVPEVKEEVKPEVKEEAKPEVKEEPKAEVKEEAKPEPTPEPKPEPTPEPKPEPTPEPEPEVQESCPVCGSLSHTKHPTENHVIEGGHEIPDDTYGVIGK